MSKVTLKPCPFCGSTDISVFYHDPYDGYQGDLGVYKVRCRQCGTTLQRKDMTEAEEAWNTRFNSVADATNIHTNS